MYKKQASMCNCYSACHHHKVWLNCFSQRVSNPSSSTIPPSRKRIADAFTSWDTPPKFSRIEPSVRIQPTVEAPRPNIIQIFHNSPPLEGRLVTKSVFIPPREVPKVQREETINELRNRRTTTKPRHILLYQPIVVPSTAPTQTKPPRTLPYEPVSSSTPPKPTSQDEHDGLPPKLTPIQDNGNDLPPKQTSPSVEQAEDAPAVLSGPPSSVVSPSESFESCESDNFVDEENRMLKQKVEKIGTCVSMIIEFSHALNLHPVVTASLMQIKNFCRGISDEESAGRG